MKLKLCAAAAAGLMALAPAHAADQQFVSIGTGGVTGVYYPTGGAICRLVNKDRKDHGIRCSVESTGGSIYNINTIRSGELEFGVAQSDWQYHAFNGTSKFEEAGPFEDLRAVFSVHAEPVTILARADSGINNITDIPGKRFNIGNPGSGTLGTWEVIEGAMGWKREDLALAGQMKSSETPGALCDNKIDGYFWLVGHPSAVTQEPVAHQVIPATFEDEADEGSESVVYDYEPSEEQILADLLPRWVATAIFGGLLENGASEQGARMSAMDNATRNAGDMIDKLTIQYNRSRQAVITNELIEIISGAEAL